jgi:hypothetical protein
MALAGRRSRRRRRGLVLAVLLTLTVLAVNAAVSARSNGPSIHQSAVAYIDGLRPLVERSTQQGADLDDVRAQAVTLGRDAIDRRLDRVARDAGTLLRDGRLVVPPPRQRLAHDLFVAALAIRAHAAAGVRRAMADALGQVPPEAVIDALASAGRDMAASDRTYQLFVDALPKLEAVLPASQWQRDEGAWSRPVLGGFVASLRSSAALSPVHDLAVLVVDAEPAAVGTDGELSVLPAAKNLKLQVVVSDNGNEAEHHATVSATLTPSAIGPVDTARDFVDLAPGQRRTVILGTLRPAPNIPTTLTVRIDPVPGETGVTDNEKTLMFTMR